MAKDLNGLQAGTVQSNNVNDPQPRVIRGKNQFPQSFQHPSTCLYGLVDPVAAAKCEPGDVYPYKFVTDLNTFTLKSPMKSKVNMYSAAFKVPMEAIYPRNYEIMFPIPNKGDDVPADLSESCRCLFSPYNFVDSFNILFSADSASSLNVDLYVKSIFCMESVYSAGSIFSKFNIHLDSTRFAVFDRSGSIVDNVSFIFDDWFDQVFIPRLRLTIVDNVSYLVYYDSDEISDVLHVTLDTQKVGFSYYDDLSIRNSYISFDRAVELLRTGDWHIENAVDFSSSPLFDGRPVLQLGLVEYYPPTNLNIEPIVAYQLSCAQFFNNPKVDYIYSADLWRDNLQSLWVSVFSDTRFPTFEWNGIIKQYDVVSARVLNDMYSFERFLRTDPSVLDLALSFWLSLFGFQNSLRYGDYFTGAHVEPLAVGDITIDDPADPLEITRKLQLTRLLNKVNISGPKKDDYLRVVFGTRIPEAPKDVPIRLSLERYDVSGFEVNNTGADQLDSDVENITTTNLRLDTSRFMFEVEIDEPCWLVMVQYFDAHRIYSKTIDRFAYHRDRYDDFIPDLQFTGDQDVKISELFGVDGTEELSFAYNLRYMEYKQRYSYASGGFINKLKSWALVTDNTDGNPATDHISPSYIRSSPSEFDRFYKSLTGYSLGTRFHFITFNTNVAQPYRQMVYAPEILA